MASSLANVRAALAETLAQQGLQVYPQLRATVNGPAAVVTLNPKTSGNFSNTFGLDGATWYFNVLLLVGESDLANASDILDGYITQRGPQSLREFIYVNHTLGLDDVDAFVEGVSNVGGTMTIAGNKYLGATVRIVVTVT